VDGFSQFFGVFAQKSVFLTRIGTLADYPQGKKTRRDTWLVTTPLGEQHAQMPGVVGATLDVA
jgi:hypothetical protein